MAASVFSGKTICKHLVAVGLISIFAVWNGTKCDRIIWNNSNLFADVFTKQLRLVVQLQGV